MLETEGSKFSTITHFAGYHTQ